MYFQENELYIPTYVGLYHSKKKKKSHSLSEILLEIWIKIKK